MADIGIDPWGSDDSTDYDALSERFGLEKIDLSTINNPSMLQRRDLVSHTETSMCHYLQLNEEILSAS